jgi:hypothetical protein
MQDLGEILGSELRQQGSKSVAILLGPTLVIAGAVKQVGRLSERRGLFRSRRGLGGRLRIFSWRSMPLELARNFLAKHASELIERYHRERCRSISSCARRCASIRRTARDRRGIERRGRLPQSHVGDPCADESARDRQADREKPTPAHAGQGSFGP